MALIPVQDQDAAITTYSCAAGGDEFANSGRELVYVINTGTLKTVKLVGQGYCSMGAKHDIEQDVDQNESVLIGPIDRHQVNDAAGRCQVEYPSGVTGLGIAVIRIYRDPV